MAQNQTVHGELISIKNKLEVVIHALLDHESYDCFKEHEARMATALIQGSVSILEGIGAKISDIVDSECTDKVEMPRQMR